mmetsp:Transcript_2595/g.8668  ORF Transcript_2595/g.8668 Transcript_2595/m.8668 type:complete len:320 (+) Transcript_2595:3653-4612(+)
MRCLVLPLRLQLLRELQADVRDARGREGLSESQSAVPLAEVRAHVEGEDGVGGGEEELLRERVVVDQQRDLPCQQVLVLVLRQLLQRHHVGAVFEVAADVERDLGLEQLEGGQVQLVPLAALPEGDGVLEGIGQATEGEGLSELGGGGGEEVVGVEAAVRVEDETSDGAHVGLMRQHPVDENHGRQVTRRVSLPDLVDPGALESCEEELVGHDASLCHRHEHALLLHVPQHLAGLRREVRDLEHGGVDGVMDEALEGGVDHHKPRSELIGGEELDALRVTEVTGASLILEGEVDDCSLTRRVDQKVFRQLHARHLCLLA